MASLSLGTGQMPPCGPGRPVHQEGSEHSSLPSCLPHFPLPFLPSLCPSTFTEQPLRRETGCLHAVEEEMLRVTFQFMRAGLSITGK